MLERRISNRRRLDGPIEAKKPKRGVVGVAARAIGAEGGRLAVRSRAAIRQTFQLGISRGMLSAAARLVWDKKGRARLAAADPSGERVGWNGVCRRGARDTVTAAPREEAILRARIDAIVARSNKTDRPRHLRLV